MIDSERPHSEFGELSVTDPIECLLRGEQLIAEGELQRGDKLLSDGIAHLNRILIDSNPDDLTDDARKELAILLTSLHYTRAESLRVRAATALEPESEAFYANLAHAELDILRDFNKDNLTFISPHTSPSDEALLNNALTYLVSRSRGLLALQRAQTQGTVGFPGGKLTIAYDNLYTADEALASGIYREPPLAAPLLPLPETASTEDKAAAAAAYTLYKERLRIINVERRGQRRATDPELATALHATTTQLSRANEDLFDAEGMLIPSPSIILPDFTRSGPRVSSIFEID